MPPTAALFPIEMGKKRQEHADGDLVSSCLALFDDLDAAKLLGPAERAKKAVLLGVARSLERALAEESLSVAAANTFKQYVETIERLPHATTGGDDPLDALDLALMAATGKALSEVYPNE